MLESCGAVEGLLEVVGVERTASFERVPFL